MQRLGDLGSHPIHRRDPLRRLLHGTAQGRYIGKGPRQGLRIHLAHMVNA